MTAGGAEEMIGYWDAVALEGGAVRLHAHGVASARGQSNDKIFR